MDQREIYEHHAEAYDALVDAEDCDHNLLPALASIVPLTGAVTLEVGIGTGRMARLLLPRVARLVGIDRAPRMLEVARRHLETMNPSGPWELHCADARRLPVPSGFADLALAAWVFGHFRLWLPVDWRADVQRALDEMARALKPGGTMVIVETLGTGREDPLPPSPELAEYFAWLEEAQGMKRMAIRTDYLFPDAATAAKITGFFFGDAFGERALREQWTRVPECTGIWWKQFA